MMHFSSSPRIAFVDLTFNWPPVGGCWVDAHHVMIGMQKRGAMVKLFCPDFQEYYPRGSVRETMPYPVEKIPFNRYTFNYATVQKRFAKAVNAFQADCIFVMDGYHMKNHILSALGPERCFLRFYAYELMCINLHYFRYHENRICNHGFLENPKECGKCWFRRMPPAGRAVQILLGMKEQHPKLHFSQEYLFSLAFTKWYQDKLKDNLKHLAGAIVYNSFIAERMQPYIDNIVMIPSGVDEQAFYPNDGGRGTLPRAHADEGYDKVKIFLPGRANDPLKGMETLIQACDTLHQEGLPFEVHYTAAMDCPAQREWLINRGWVNQSQLAALYQEMDIAVVPSLWIEPFGITALEGMSSGIPVVASRTGGLAHSVVHGETGYHIEPGNAVELADALRKLIVDEPLRRQLGINGRQRITELYAWDRILDRHYMPMLEQYLSNQKTAVKT